MTTEAMEQQQSPEHSARGARPTQFETLNTIGQLVSGLGWAVAIVGLMAGLVSLSRLGIAGLGVVLIAPLYGVLIVGYGQALQCVVAISRNTERTAELLSNQKSG